MASRVKIVVEVQDSLGSPKVHEHILGQVRHLFDRFSDGLGDTFGRNLKVTIGPWKAQHNRWTGECFIGLPQSLHVAASSQNTQRLDEFDGVDTLEPCRLQIGESNRLIQQHFDEQNLAERDDPCSAGDINRDDLKVLFPGQDFGVSFEISPSPFSEHYDPHEGSMAEMDTSSQPLPSPKRLLPLNLAKPLSSRECHARPQTSDETLIHPAASNLATRPTSDTDQRHSYRKLQWKTPRSPADYSTPASGKPSKSCYPSRGRE